MNSKFQREEDSFSTIAVHAGYSPDDCLPHRPVVEPLISTSTYKQSKPGVFEVSSSPSSLLDYNNRSSSPAQEFNYSRCGNPCRNNLEQRLAAMEDAKYAAVFPTGLSVVYGLATLFQSGDHFVVSNDLYGGTLKCFMNMEKRRGMQIDYVDMTKDLIELKSVLRSDTKMLWFESPSNPTMSVVDIRAVCEMAKSVAKDVLIVIDNTVLTPYFQKPLELGVTICMYSLTKYTNGHADVVMGAAVTNCPNINEELRIMQEGMRGLSCFI